MVHRAVRCFIVLGAGLPGIASAATIAVTPTGSEGAATLDDALASAADGDNLQLAPGDYPATKLVDRNLSIEAAAVGVKMASLDVQGGQLTLSGIEFTGSGAGLAIRDAEVNASELVFFGAGTPRNEPAIRVSGQSITSFDRVDIQAWNSTSGTVLLVDAGSTEFSRSSFLRNHATHGGALRVERGSLVVTDCEFGDNSAEEWGGDIAATAGTLSVYGSRFTRSHASKGGAIAAGGSSIVEIEDTEFQQPTATLTGGFLYLEEATATLSRVAGVDAASEMGGAIALFRATLTAEDLNLARNKAVIGGHIHGSESSASLLRTHMTAGTAEQGAAVAWSKGSLDVVNALWVSQEGAAAGGALYASDGNVRMFQATISDNRAESGSAVAMNGGSVTIDSSILSDLRGDALVVTGTGQLKLQNSILVDVDGANTIGNVMLDNSVMAADPQFTRPKDGDYTLRATSPALDVLPGDGDPDGTATDLGAFGGPDSWILPDADEDGYVYGRDCMDNDASIHEGADDPWYDGIDSNCLGDDDFDQDGDDHRAAAYGGMDCDDTDETRFPGALEASGDTVDADCDGLMDRDSDGDGWTEGLDCDDNDPSVHPMAVDAWYDDIDSDCGGNDDFDADRDGTSTLEGDCDDTDDRVYPDAAEVAGDGVDQDCDGSDLVIADPDSSVSDSEASAAGTESVPTDPERILTKAGCSTVPGMGATPASILGVCGFLLLFNNRRRD